MTTAQQPDPALALTRSAGYRHCPRTAFYGVGGFCARGMRDVTIVAPSILDNDSTVAIIGGMSDEFIDASGRLVCVGKANISYDHFADVAKYLLKLFKGKVVEKLEDGFSERWWDVTIDNTKVCFHYNNMISNFEITSLEGSKSDGVARKLAAMLL